jgi:hypothetical protein
MTETIRESYCKLWEDMKREARIGRYFYAGATFLVFVFAVAIAPLILMIWTLGWVLDRVTRQ